ncbi:hypothetical protein [Muribacter muris]|uniref:hypothetical protein n=1 Tax=Muribacter muris TaxID=67855 RepID=UPI00064E0D2D|nr:hypothetical protein [Muribacter muris]
MPLPFILAGLAVAAVGTGAKKAYDGYQDNSEAERIIDSAKSEYSKATKELEESHNKLNKKIESVGNLRLHIGGRVKELKEMAEKLQEKLKLISSEKTFNFNISNIKLKRIDAFGLSVAEFTTGIASGAIAGGVAAYAAYGGTMALATASTGTAISSLAGAAATKATLASLGGGSLAAGGFGIAGGTALLGGVVAAPIIAIAAWTYASNAEENLSKARQYKRDAENAIEKMEKIKGKYTSVACYVDNVYWETKKIENIFNSYYAEVKKMYKAVFVKKLPRNEVENLAERIGLAVQNGLAIASIITDICIIPLFKMDSENEVLLDNDNIPMDNEEKFNNQLAECKRNKLLA